MKIKKERENVKTKDHKAKLDINNPHALPRDKGDAEMI